MTSKVILQKKSKDDTFGYLYILYSDGNKRQKVSLKERMDEDHFNDNYDKEFKRFRKKTHLKLNEKIDELIKIKDIFNQPRKKETSFLNYYRTQFEKIEKPSTKTSYLSSYKKLNTYLQSINKTDLLFSELTKDFNSKYVDYLRNKSLTDSAIKTYLSSMKAVMNTAIDDDEYYYTKNPFRKLELKINVKPKRLLNRQDISKLRHIKKEDDLFIYSRMFLLSLYAQGMRFSDLILLKIENIKRDTIEYKMLKNKKDMKISIDRNINKMLIDVLGLDNYYEQYKEIKINTLYSNDQSFSYSELFKLIRKRYDNLPSKNNLITYKNFEMVDKNNDELLSYIDQLEVISNHIDVFIKKKINEDTKKLPKEQYLFQSFIKSEIFKDYNKLTTFTPEQYNKIKSLNSMYHCNLKRICKKFELSVDMLSSHNARHTFVNRIITLDGLNLNDVRVTLGHSELSTTQSYIDSGFEFKKNKIITDEFTKDHRL